MGASFTGYSLVAAQIRFWAVMVITSLLRVIPLNGDLILFMIWGGYRISWVTYQTLIVVHFILPFIVIFLIVLHLLFLHNSGRANTLIIYDGISKIGFFPLYWVKDLLNIFVWLVLFFFILLYPYALG